MVVVAHRTATDDGALAISNVLVAMPLARWLSSPEYDDVTVTRPADVWSLGYVTPTDCLSPPAPVTSALQGVRALPS